MPSVHPVSERANKDMILRFDARTKLELYRQEPESVDEFFFTVSAVCIIDKIMPTALGHVPMAFHRSKSRPPFRE